MPFAGVFDTSENLNKKILFKLDDRWREEIKRERKRAKNRISKVYV